MILTTKCLQQTQRSLPSRTHSLATPPGGPGCHTASDSCPNPTTVYATWYSNIHAIATQENATTNHTFCSHPFVRFHASSRASHYACNLYTCLLARRQDPDRPLQNCSIRRKYNASRCGASAATRNSCTNPAGTHRPHPSLDISREATLPKPAADPCQHDHPCDCEWLSHSRGQVFGDHPQ